METIRITFAGSNATISQKTGGSYSWDDPLSQPRDPFFESSPTLKEPVEEVPTRPTDKRSKSRRR